MHSISEFLSTRDFNTYEGNSQEIPRQVKDLIELTKNSNISVMEIGFNAGHSAEIFLKNNPSLTLTSFDLGSHEYILTAKEYIDITYPNRHTLILGDSTKTVPKYINDNLEKKFDIIFIDGGHDYNIAKSDLENCRNLANKDTIVIIDDTIYTKSWVRSYTVGPTRTWNEHIKNGTITNINNVDYINGRGMSWGTYIF